MENEEKTLDQLLEELKHAEKVHEDVKRLVEQKRKEEVERKKAALEAEKDKRKKEVDDAISKAVELVKAYNEDYGTYSITDRFNDFSFLFGSKPWRFFL